MDVARERSETSGPHRDGAMPILLAAMASISLLVRGIGIMNILLVSVSERTG